MGEAVTLINNFKVDKAIINTGKFNYLEKNFINNFPNYIIGNDEYSFSVGEFKFLSINSDLGEENDNSLIFYITIRDYKMMFMGDASVKSEENILNKYNLGHINILKAGHHGSRTSSSENFIKTIRPNTVLISAGVDNKFGHPHKDVLERFEKYKSRYFVTNELGTITINFNNKNIYFDK